MESTAYVTTKAGNTDYTYHFTGVVSIEHNLALNIGNDASQGGDIINGAKNLPDQVRLSVVETDVAHSKGWSKQMLAAMMSLKKNRYLCKVVTSMGTYKDMLLTEITATQDEANQFGWAGDLVFMKYIPYTALQTGSGGGVSWSSGSGGSSSRKTQNNSSTSTNTGTRVGSNTISGVAASIVSGINAAIGGNRQ